MKLTEKKIRDIAGRSGSRSGGGGGGGGVSASWVDENYVAIKFFNEIFVVKGKKTTTVGSGTPTVNNNYVFAPNETPGTKTTTEGGVTTTVVTEITNIQVKAGLWTQKFLSALGQGTGGSGSSGTLHNLDDVDIDDSTLHSGQILVYRNSHWVNENMPSPGGSGTVTSVGMSVPTGLLVSGASSKTITNAGTFAITFATGYSLLAASDKTEWNALLTYFDSNGNAKHALVADALSVAAAKTAWGQTYLNANGEPLNVSGDMSDVGDITMDNDSRISTANNGDLYIGNSSNMSYVKIQDMCSALGDTYWKILASGVARFAGTTFDGDITFTYEGNNNARYINFKDANDNSTFYIKKLNDRFAIGVNGTETINFYDTLFYSAVQIRSAVGVLSDGYVTALSDIRFKEVVSHFEIDIDEMAAASLIRFTWKGRDDQTVHAGGIAQEWQKILPEAVVESEDGRLAMDYGVIGTAAAVSLARKVKAQQQEIDELKKQNAEMENRLARLEKLMEKGGFI